jgi:Spy/CpxP family protein refolding chaperone
MFKRFIRSSIIAASLVVGTTTFATVALANPAHAQHGTQASHAHGPLDVALSQAQLRADQKTAVEALKKGLEPSRTAARAAHKDLVETLAAQIAANKVDRAALQPKIDAFGTAAGNERAAERASLDKLHGILDAKQRVAFADAMEARANHAGHAGGAAHGGKAKNAPDAAKVQAMKDAQKKIWEAFKQDKFAMDSVAPNDARAKTIEHEGKMVDALKTKVASMTPEQRTAFATKMKERASKSH